MKLRDYQHETVTRMLAEAKHGNATLGVLPTGSGKSHVAAALAEAYPRALILAHRQELLTQNAAKLNRNVTFACTGLGKPDFSGDIVVASRDTARARCDQLPSFDAVIIDEAHLVGPQAKSGYQRIITAARHHNPDVHLFGLTATPWRLGMGHLTRGKTFDTVAHEVGYLDLVDRGFLSPLRAFAPRSGQISTEGLKVQATGDYAQRDLIDRLGGSTVQIARYIRKALEVRNSALIFCVNVDHVREMTAAMTAMGIPCAGLTQKSKNRTEILAKLKSGEIRAVANCEILTTGFDHPPLDVIALARPTASPILAMQMLGRGTRIADGKRDCVVLDFGNVIATNGPITDPVIPKPRKRGKATAAPPVKPCPKCSAILSASARSCHECDWTAPPPKPDLSMRPSEIDPMGRHHLQAVESVTLVPHESAAGNRVLKAIWEITGRSHPVHTFYALDDKTHARKARRKLFYDLGVNAFSVSQAVKMKITPPARVQVGKNAGGYPVIEVSQMEATKA